MLWLVEHLFCELQLSAYLRTASQAVFGIRVPKTRMFLGLLDPGTSHKGVEKGTTIVLLDKMEPPRSLMVAKLNSKKHL